MYLRDDGRFLMGGCWTSLVVEVEEVTSWQMRRSPPSLEDGVIERGRGDAEAERSSVKRRLLLLCVAITVAAPITAGVVVDGLDWHL